LAEYRRFEFHYGVIMLRTRRFQAVMDRLGRTRITGPAGWFLLYLMPVAAAVALFLFLSQLGILLSPRGQAVASYIRTLSPLGNLGIPGINPYLPIVDGWLALIVAMVVHEGAHGVIARGLGLPVKSSGLLFFLFLPIGAFVEVDEDALKAAKPSHSGRVLAGGAGINLVVGVVCLLLLFGVVSAMSPQVRGIGVVGVYSNYPAAQLGIKPGDFITAINGLPVDNPVVVANSSWYKPGGVVDMTVWRSGGYMQFIGVKLGNITINDTRTGTVSQRAFLGVADVGYADLTKLVSVYKSSFFVRPALYLCIPTLPVCQGLAPFSDNYAPLYSSSYRVSLAPLANVLYWMFFINFNLAIFNSLPIYPLDGGQAFKVGVKALGGDRLSERALSRITSAASIAVIAVLLAVLAGPYLIW
jgi:membrane-associated protease RseP (regulator of RpoE activity)